jgi:hypothetical protein
MNQRSIAAQQPLAGGHPRGRGFHILSRLARDSAAGRRVADVDPGSEAPEMLTFAQPRHRAEIGHSVAS